MPLDIPDGAECFVDANILHYALVPTFETSSSCLSFLDRAVEGLISLSVSAQTLCDVLHKVMTSEVAEITGRNRAGIVGYLKKHPNIIKQLVKYPQTVSRLDIVPMRVLSVDQSLVDSVPQIAQTHSLLTNDAMIVALMRRNGLTHLVTNDDDFDRVPGITVWKPRP